MYFCNFVIISSWKGCGPSFKSNLFHFSQGCFVPSMVEIGPVVLDKKIFKFRQCIDAISKLSSFGKGQTWIPTSQGCWFKLAQWFLERRFFKIVNAFSQFPNYLPLEKGGDLHLNKLESPSTKNALCQVWLK